MRAAKKSFLNILTGVLGQCITIAIGLLLPRLFITSYGSETNGFLSSINNLIYYLTLLEAGIGGATIQALYGPIAKGDRGKINGILAATNLFYKRTGVIYGLCVLAMAVIYPLLVPSELSPALQVGIILLVGSSGVIGYLFQAKFRLLLQAEGKQYVIANVTTGVHVLTSIGKLICVMLGLMVIWLQVVHFALALFSMAIYYLYIHKNYQWLDLNVQPDEQAIAQKGYVLVHQVSEMIFNHVDVLLLTFLLKDLKIVSVYVLYTLFVDMVSTLISNVNTGFVFKLGQLFNSDRKSFEPVFDLYETYYMAFSFALYTVTYLFLMPFMRLYTAGVSDANYLLPWLPLLFVAYKLLVCGRAACGGLASYAGHFQQTRWHSICETAINLLVSIGTVILFEKYWNTGIYGVLLGTLAALIFRANIMIVYANTKILPRGSWSTYRKWLLDFAIMIGGCAIFRLANPRLDSYPRLIAWAGVWCAMFLAGFFVINALCNISQARWLYRQVTGMMRMRFAKG